jgi:hypothetical protein
MSLARILVCLDTDPQPSVFDAIVAVDAGVDQVLRHGAVTPETVRSLVYGAMFTRGPDDLKNTALFIGGSDVAAGEKLLGEIRRSLFGATRVSVMIDSGGANTTAAAAVLIAQQHVGLAGETATVLAATGSVGRRVVRLLARRGAHVRATSRRLERARRVCGDVGAAVPNASLEAIETSNTDSLRAAIEGATILVAAGAPAVELVPEALRAECRSVQVAIDLNAVPPAGLGGVDPHDDARQRDGQICHGAIAVGGVKMKLHKAAMRRLFDANDLVLDAEEIYELGSAMAL